MKVRILGIGDDVTTCQCCGKTNLKRTVALEFRAYEPDSEVRRYGVDCAGKALKRGSAAVKSAAECARRYGADWVPSINVA